MLEVLKYNKNMDYVIYDLDEGGMMGERMGVCDLYIK